MHPRTGAAGLVQPRHQGAHHRQARRVGGAHQQCIQGGIGQHQGRRARPDRCPAPAGACAGRRGGVGCRCGRAAPVQQLLHRGGQRGGLCVLQRDHLHVGGVGRVQRGDERAQPRQVACVVGDHQRVAAGVDVDGVVGADERAQHRHQVGRAFVHQRDDLGDDVVALGGSGRRACRCRSGQQAGLGLGHHLAQPGGLDHGVAQPAQTAGEQLPGLSRRDRVIGVEGELALDARVHQHRSVDDGTHGAGHRVDVGVLEVQCHFRSGRGGSRRGGGAGRAGRRGGHGAGARQRGRQQGREKSFLHGRHCDAGLSLLAV